MFTITSQYGYRKRPNTGKTEFTSGTDIVPQTKDKSVPSLAPGKIVNIAVDKYAQGGLLDPSKHKGLGYYIDVEVSSGPYAGHVVRYGHLDPIKNKDQLLGKTVNVGDKLASFGVGSGSGTGPHVKVYLIDPKGNKINPNKLLSEAKKTLTSGTTGTQDLTSLASTAESFSKIDPNSSTKKLADAQKQDEKNLNQQNLGKNTQNLTANIGQYQGLASPQIYQSTPTNQFNLQQLALNRQKELNDLKFKEKNNALDQQYAQKTESYKKPSIPIYQPQDNTLTSSVPPTKYLTTISDMNDDLAATTSKKLSSIKSSQPKTNDYYGLNLNQYFQYG